MSRLHDDPGWCPDVATLRALIAVVRERHFTRAARVLGTTTATLSRQVQRLERDLGSKLVIRAPGGPVLTEAGARLLARAGPALALLDAARSEVADLDGTPKGTVRLGAIVTVATYVLPDLVAEFRSRHSGVQVLIQVGSSRDLEALIAGGEIDLAMVIPPLRRKGLTAVMLWCEDYVLVVPPGHRLAQARRPVALAEVTTEPFIVPTARFPRAALESACAVLGKRPVIAAVSGSLEGTRQMVEAGMGLALVPRIVTRDPRWREGLVPIASGGMDRHVALVHRGASYLTSTARALRDAIRAYARRGVVSPRPAAGSARQSDPVQFEVAGSDKNPSDQVEPHLTSSGDQHVLERSGNGPP